MALSRFLKTLKQSVRGRRWYLALSEARWAYQDAWVHFRQRRAEQACVSLRAPGRDPAGAVLFSYVIDPFLYPELAEWAGQHSRCSCLVQQRRPPPGIINRVEVESRS